MRIVISQAPANALLPNNRSRNHWSSRSAATTELRKAAKYEAYEQKPAGWQPILTYKATVEVEWDAGRYTARRMPDLDGVLNACKPAIDGLQDAGIIVDDKYAVEYTIRQRIGDTGRIIIDLEEVS
jgi:Holliday junction resolvase RusA-like endonuclease